MKLYHLDDEIGACLRILQDLTYDVNHAIRGGKALDPLIIDTVVTSVQYRLLSNLPLSSCHTQRDTVEESLRLGCLVYINTIHPQFPEDAETHRGLIEKFQTCLNRIVTASGNISEFLLWSLLLGGTMVSRDPIRTWFVARLADTATHLYLLSWDHDVKPVILKFLWIERVHEAASRALWD